MKVQERGPSTFFKDIPDPTRPKFKSYFRSKAGKSAADKASNEGSLSESGREGQGQEEAGSEPKDDGANK